jgi:uncharacterized glyoxalase superfamily protein PhnB
LFLIRDDYFALFRRAFMIAVFGATIGEQFGRPDGKIGHAEVRLGDSLVMVGDVREGQEAAPVMLHVYVDDADATFEIAIQAGAPLFRRQARIFTVIAAGV